MKDVVVIGAGKIGATVAGLLASTGDYQVTLADRSPEVLGNLDRDERIRVMAADVEDSLKLVDLFNGQFAVLNAAPFRLTKPIAEAVTTAAAICTVLDLLATGQLPQSGFIRQEDIALKVFLENRFGDVYANPETSVPHQRFGGSER